MSWSTLKARLAINPSPVPLIIAGPVLREVTPLNVTVWFASRVPVKITLRVFNGSDQVMEGARHTTPIGTNLHLVAVTAKVLPPKTGLVENTIFEYDALFDFEPASLGTGVSLKMATGNRTFSYLDSERPSFCLPPSDPNSLRIIHGSCRHANGDGKDSLALVDTLIQQAALVASERPHQLLLMGDQLYADDVGGSMLLLLTEASDTLLGWQEILPVPGVPAGMRGNQLPPYWRFQVARDAGFTSDAQWNHLMTLGEYLCMYLFSWSDALWETMNLPMADDVTEATAGDDSTRARIAFGQLRDQRKGMLSDIANVGEFTKKLIEIRRVLANIPTYMILDDHDVTDDYNMTRDIAVGVYRNPMGRRLVQNALVAYALCQHWGNVPNDFDESNPASPGMKLLALFKNMDEHVYDASTTALQSLAGVHDDKAIMSPPGTTVPGVFHDSGGFTYSYTIEGVGHQIIVTDTRTMRSFPRKGDEHSDLLRQTEIDTQITNAGKPTGNRILIVVLSTNMPPVPIIRWFANNPTLPNAAEYYPDLFDSWELPSDAFDRVARAISTRLPIIGDVATGRAVLLSGDVHSSFATRLLYVGTSRFGDIPAAKQPVKAVFAQLISSSLKNQTGRTVTQHHKGYDYSRVLVSKHRPEAYVGYNAASAAPEHVMDYASGPSPDDGSFDLSPVNLTASRTFFLSEIQDLFDVRYVRKPDWGYRFDYLTADVQKPVPITTTVLPPIPPGATKEERAKQFAAVTGDYRTFLKQNTNKEMIGLTNVSELTFALTTKAGETSRAIHTVRWANTEATGDPLLFTTYAVSLDPDDPKFSFDTIAKVKVGP